MKECELCDSPARMYCESDQASLCWDCDAKVHSANFLVARHSRSLLCHACQSLTAWKASGTKLGPTVSVCEKCFSNCNGRQGKGEEEEEDDNDDDDDDDDESQGGNDDEDESDADETDEDNDQNDDDDDDDDDDGGGDDGDCEEDGDNQVVPWSSTPPPPVASSSSSEESCSRFCSSSRGVGETSRSLSLKRMREKLDLSFQDDLGCSTSQRTYTHAALTADTIPTAEEEEEEEEATSFVSYRPPKKDRRIEVTTTIQSTTHPHNTSATLVSSLKRLEQKMISAGNHDDAAKAMILDICKLSKNPSTV